MSKQSQPSAGVIWPSIWLGVSKHMIVDDTKRLYKSLCCIYAFTVAECPLRVLAFFVLVLPTTCTCDLHMETCKWPIAISAHVSAHYSVSFLCAIAQLALDSSCVPLLCIGPMGVSEHWKVHNCSSLPVQHPTVSDSGCPEVAPSVA